MVRLSILFLAICLSSPLPEAKWTPLFNGRNLDGWDTWLAVPDSSFNIPGAAKNSDGLYTTPLGLNNDPLKVFGVAIVDGAPSIHISGQGFGALTTQQVFGNFHLSLDYKWGEQKWPPRQNAKRDSGILYYCVGEHGAGGGAWMRSQECQVQEGDTGDYWSVGGAIADVHADSTELDGVRYLQYTPTAPSRTIGKNFDGVNWKQLRCIHSAMAEKTNSEWNHVDIYAYNGKSVHVVNGKTVMVLENSRQILNGKEVPLLEGKIQLQTEGAEIYYRDVKIRKIKSLPTLP